MIELPVWLFWTMTMMGVVGTLLAGTVLGRVLALARNNRRAVKAMAKRVVRDAQSLLDEPRPCPLHDSSSEVTVRRSAYTEDGLTVSNVEHFYCKGCGHEFLGPNQRTKLAAQMAFARAYRAQRG